MARGNRESTWLVIRRCLAIIRRAQRGPASREDLIQAMLKVERPEHYGRIDEEELNKLHLRLDKDLRRIRDHLMVDLSYNRRLGKYEIKDTWMPLLDLPDEALETIAWLERTFGHESPKHDEVHDLLKRLRLYLDMERVAVIEQTRSALEVDLRQRDKDDIPTGVWQSLTKAFAQGLQVELLYLSPQYEDGEPRRHVVEPYDPYHFDAKRGHYYLQAYCRQVEGPDGIEYPNAYLTYRLGRIQKLKVLPQKLPPMAPSKSSYRVEYELAPGIARMGVTHHPEIKIHDVEHRDDGSAVVRGETESVFWAVRTLLHYGPNCKVLGGPKVRREMERVVREMAAAYESGNSEA